MINEKINYKDIQVEVNLKEKKIITAVNENDGSNIEIELLQYLPLGKVSGFVQIVIDSLNEDMMGYMTEHESFIIDKTFIEFYTNIQLPNDISECSLFIAENQPLIRKMMNEVHQEQLMSIFDAIKYKKEILKEKEIKQNDDLDLLIINFGNIIRNLNEMLSAQMFNFKDVDVSTLIKNLSQKKLSEEKVIEKILDYNKKETTKKSTKNKDDKVIELPSENKE